MEKLMDGVYLTGRYLGTEDPNGSFILYRQNECVIVESPPDKDWLPNTQAALAELGHPTVLFTSETHRHWDHFNKRRTAFTETREFPETCGDHLFWVGGEPLWVITCPKHSPSDKVFVFKGVALTGDLELGQLESPNLEVSVADKIRSLNFLAEFVQRQSYYIHTVISSHLNDFRTDLLDWKKVVLPPLSPSQEKD